MKPDNIFLTEDGIAKIGDYGLSSQLNHTQSVREYAGTKLYVSHLHDQRIDISRDKFARRGLRRRKLVLKDDGIQRGIESRPVTVGIFGGTGNILDAVGGGTARPEAGAAHIDGIRTVVYGRHGRLQIPCRSQQFDTSHHNSFYAAKILTFVSKEIRRGKKKK